MEHVLGRWRRKPVLSGRSAGSTDAGGDPGAEVIAVRRGGEKTKLLVGVGREPCPHCHSGERVVSTWCTLKGTTERLSWCQHCFNAQCSLAGLSEDERGTFERARAAVAASVQVRYFDCARHAVEYLRRREGEA